MDLAGVGDIEAAERRLAEAEDIVDRLYQRADRAGVVEVDPVMRRARAFLAESQGNGR